MKQPRYINRIYQPKGIAFHTSSRDLQQIVKDMKKHISRAWDDVVFYLN